MHILRLLVLLGAMALVLGGGPLRAALAMVGDAEAHCCCGRHDADDDCGCPDCPGGAHGKRQGTPLHDEPQLNACGLTAELATPVALELAVPTACLAVTALIRVTVVPAIDARDLRVGVADAPPIPPPR